MHFCCNFSHRSFLLFHSFCLFFFLVLESAYFLGLRPRVPLTLYTFQRHEIRIILRITPQHAGAERFNYKGPQVVELRGVERGTRPLRRGPAGRSPGTE